VKCEVTPIGLLAWVVMCFFSHAGEVYLSQSTQSSLSLFAHVSSPQKASGIQSSQSVTDKGGCKVLWNRLT